MMTIQNKTFNICKDLMGSQFFFLFFLVNVMCHITQIRTQCSIALQRKKIIQQYCFSKCSTDKNFQVTLESLLLSFGSKGENRPMVEEITVVMNPHQWHIPLPLNCITFSSLGAFACILLFPIEVA